MSDMLYLAFSQVYIVEALVRYIPSNDVIVRLLVAWSEIAELTGNLRNSVLSTAAVWQTWHGTALVYLCTFLGSSVRPKTFKDGRSCW